MTSLEFFNVVSRQHYFFIGAFFNAHIKWGLWQAISLYPLMESSRHSVVVD